MATKEISLEIFWILKRYVIPFQNSVSRISISRIPFQKNKILDNCEIVEDEMQAAGS